MDIYSLAAISIMLAALALGALKRLSLTLMLIIGNLLVFFLEVLGPGYVMKADLGFRPIYLQTGQDLYTIFTSMFVHMDVYHIFANMLFLFLFGWPLEERVGKWKVVPIYFAAGGIGLILESLVRWGEPTLIIGASGAISGLVGALFILYPREKMMLPLFVIILPNVPVWIATMAFFLTQMPYVLGVGGQGIAFTAHLGGFLTGMVVGALLPKVERAPKPIKLSAEGLEPLAITPELKDALEKINGESQADIRKAWLEYFAARARCPQCGSSLKLKGDKLVSECGYEVRMR